MFRKVRDITRKMIRGNNALEVKGDGYRTSSPVFTDSILDDIQARDIHFTTQPEHLFNTNVVVYRCISLISKSLASVPWFFSDKNGPVADHALNYLLSAPNPMQGKETFLEQLISNLLMFGNAYIYKSGKDDYYSMYVLNSNNITIVGSKPGMTDHFLYNNGIKTIKIPVNQTTGESDIMHIKLFNPDNEYYGMSPCQVIENSVLLYNKVTEHNLSLLKKGGRPSGVLVMKADNMPDDHLQQLKADVQKWLSGARNAGEVLVLSKDCEWKELGLKPLETDFLNGKHMASREIAQVFGVPPMLIGITGDATFANYKEARVHFWEDNIIPLMKKICSELSVWFFGKFDLTLKYDIEGVEALSPRREAVWNKISQASFLTVNEKRAELGYPPLENGDSLEITNHSLYGDDMVKDSLKKIDIEQKTQTTEEVKEDLPKNGSVKLNINKIEVENITDKDK